VDERQGHELGESSSLLLKITQPQQVTGRMPGSFEVSEHQGGGGTKTHFMRVTHYGKRLVCVQFVRTNN
jgi:hypothetical protein